MTVDLTKGEDGTYRRAEAGALPAPRPAAKQATPELLRALIRQNEESMRGMRRAPPADLASPSGRQFQMSLADLAEQTERLRAKLTELEEQPRPRRGSYWEIYGKQKPGG